MNKITFLLAISFILVGCSHALHSVKTDFTDGVALQIKLKTYKKKKKITHVRGELNSSGTKDQLNTMDLNCILLGHRDQVSNELHLKNPDPNSKNKYKANNGFIKTDVYWTFHEEISKDSLKNLRIIVDKTCRNKEWITFLKK